MGIHRGEYNMGMFRKDDPRFRKTGNMPTATSRGTRTQTGRSRSFDMDDVSDVVETVKSTYSVHHESNDSDNGGGDCGGDD